VKHACYRMTKNDNLRMLQMDPGTIGALFARSSKPDVGPRLRKSYPLRAATALIDAALLSALIWSILAVAMRCADA
jgi:hypothetical protein